MHTFLKKMLKMRTYIDTNPNPKQAFLARKRTFKGFFAKTRQLF